MPNQPQRVSTRSGSPSSSGLVPAGVPTAPAVPFPPAPLTSEDTAIWRSVVERAGGGFTALYYVMQAERRDAQLMLDLGRLRTRGGRRGAVAPRILRTWINGGMNPGRCFESR